MGSKILLFRVFIVIVLASVSYYFTSLAFDAWEESPTSTSVSWFSTKKVKFPAVTICSAYDARWIGFYEMMLDKDPDGEEAAKVFANLSRPKRNQISYSLYDITNAKFPVLGKLEVIPKLFKSCQENPDWLPVIAQYSIEKLEEDAKEFTRKAMIDWLELKLSKRNLATVKEFAGQLPVPTMSCSILNETCGSKCPYVSLYHLVKFVENSDSVMKGSYYQRFLVDLVTNRQRYPRKLTRGEWKVFSEYVTKSANISGVPGPIVSDLIGMAEIQELTLWSWDLLQFQFCPKVFKNICNPNAVLQTSPNNWPLYNKTWGSIGNKCLLAKNLEERLSKDDRLCTALEELIQKTLGHASITDLKSFAKATQRPEAHIDLTKKWFNSPMIPFCWFGKRFQWLGEIEFQADVRYHDKYLPKHDEKVIKVLRWCNIFERSFPIHKNCYTTKSDAVSGQIASFGIDSGLTLVLDASFGRNMFEANNNGAFNLYVHEHGSIPDYLSEGIPINLGMKYNISFEATKFKATETLKASSVHACWNEKRNVEKLQVFDKYSRMNCAMEKLVDKIREDCGCLPIEMLLYIDNQTMPKINTDTNVCLTFGRVCAEELLRDINVNDQLSESCKNPCDETRFTIHSQASTNLSEMSLFTEGKAKWYLKDYFSIKNEDFNGVLIDVLGQRWADSEGEDALFKRLQNIAVVSLNFKSGRAIEYTTDVKATFSDKLGTIGGTFGIFLGVSFFSLIELFLEIYNAVKDKLMVLVAWCRRKLAQLRDCYANIIMDLKTKTFGEEKL